MVNERARCAALTSAWSRGALIGMIASSCDVRFARSASVLPDLGLELSRSYDVAPREVYSV